MLIIMLVFDSEVDLNIRNMTQDFLDYWEFVLLRTPFKVSCPFIAHQQTS